MYQPKSKKRVFKLEFTDGFKTIFGMEYSIIPCLNTKLSPGCKVKITGPIQVANQILLLESKHVTILGGDVESLQVKNAYENVLLRALGKPETADPIRNYKEPAAVQVHQTQNHVTQQTQRSAPIQAPPVVSRNEVQAELIGLELDDDDDDDDLNLDELDEVENQHRTSQEEAEIAHLENEIIEIPDYQPVQPSVRSQAHSQQVAMSDIITLEDDDDDMMDYSTALSHHEEEPTSRKVAKIAPLKKTPVHTDDDYEFKTSCGCNLVTIDQYTSMSSSQKSNRNFVVFASVEEFLAKTLKIHNGEWHGQVTLSDDYSKQVLLVKVQNAVFAKFTNYSAKEMENLYKQARTAPQYKGEIVKIMNELRISMCSQPIMVRIQFRFSFTDSPSMVEAVEVVDKSPYNLEMFEKKIRAENIQVCELDSE